MSEVGEIFKAYAEVRKDKKIKNIEDSLRYLRNHQVDYKILNGSNHHTLVADVYDFWPSTGKYCKRGSNLKGRGVRSLVKHLKQNDL